MNWRVYLQLALSMAGSIAGPTGAIAAMILGGINTLSTDTAETRAFAEGWVTWLNGIIDANRAPTDEEKALANAVADAVYANNESLASGGPALPIPPPPV